jgi:hypothetical protein
MKHYTRIALIAGLTGFLGIFALGAWQFADTLAQSETVAAAVAGSQAAQAAQAQLAADRAQLELEQARQDMEAWPEAAVWRARAGAVVWFGGAVAVVVLLNGLAAAGGLWAWRKASVIYPDSKGQYPLITERQRDGALAVIDTSRMVGPVAIVCQDGDVCSPVQNETLQLEVTRQAQAASLLRGVMQTSALEQAKKQVEKIAASAALPVPTFGDGVVFAKEVAAAPRAVNGDKLRFVYVQKGEGVTEAARDLADLREFIELTPVKGLARRMWLQHHFNSGHDCTRARFDALIDKLRKANVIIQAGQSWKMNVSVESALAAFGLSNTDLDVRPAPAVIDAVATGEGATE